MRAIPCAPNDESRFPAALNREMKTSNFPDASVYPDIRMFELESSAISVRKSEDPASISMVTVPLLPNESSIAQSLLYLMTRMSTVSPLNLVPASKIFPSC